MKKHFDYKNYMGSIEPDIEEGFLFGRLMFIRDVVSYRGDSLAELKVAFEAAVDDYLETCIQLNETPEIPCKGSFNVRVGPELHQKIALAAAKESISMNEWVRDACVTKLHGMPDEKQQQTFSLVLEAAFQEDTYLSNGPQEWQKQTPLPH